MKSYTSYLNACFNRSFYSLEQNVALNKDGKLEFTPEQTTND